MTAMKLLIASAILVYLVAASSQIRLPVDGHQISPVKPQQHAEVRKRPQAPMKFNHTRTEKTVQPVLPKLESDSGLANIIRNTRQVSENSVLSQFPKIYKVDDFIIIANPKVKTTPPPCTPQPILCPMPPRPTGTPDEDSGFRMGFQTEATPTSGEPSKCVWAIVACCSPGSRNIRYSCFELLGCPGAFWDLNPCDDKVVMAAANTALQFYSRNSTGK